MCYTKCCCKKLTSASNMSSAGVVPRSSVHITCATSQFAPLGNHDQATKTSKELGDRPPYPGWEVPYRGAQSKGGRPSCRCVRYGSSAACKPKGEATTQTLRGEGYGNSGCHPPPSTYYSTSAFELSARSPSLTPEPHEVNLPRT
uniref:RxLR effector candidate protein n=1 Tax=Hyaloperonospora arabidopsidis (strain Emoy2) TaxID=559515 RepID=M4BI67_HYAAE